jgi:transposase
MVIHHAAGDKLMIDFAGKKMSYIDRLTAEGVSCNLFIAVLPHSGYAFVEACPTQTISDFVHCTTRCLQALEGVSKVNLILKNYFGVSKFVPGRSLLPGSDSA